MSDAVIVAAARTPIGRAGKGTLTEFRADDLTAAIVAAAFEQVPQASPADFDELILGCAQPAGEQGYNLGRMVALRLGYDQLPGTTVNRYCASSLQAIRMAFHAIRAGEGERFIAAGVEMVSRFERGKSDGMPDTKNPRYADAGQRTLERSRSNETWRDPRSDGELPDVYIAMGETAENVATLHSVSRAAQDEWAARSQRLAEEARTRGFWDRDITPVQAPNGSWLSTDDSPRPSTTLEALSGLAPVFREAGTVSAGNCCPLNDGAAALLIMSAEAAQREGLTPLARILATGVSALSPEIMGMGPVEASRRALKNAGMTIDQMDQIEINEAFAAQVIPSIAELGADPERVNVNGGAIALGHPFGMTGARIATTMLHSLQERDERFGLETMCVAGGQGMALIIERL